MANPILELIQKDGKFDPKKIVILVVLLVILAWMFSKLFGKTNAGFSVMKKQENLEIITTDNAIPNTPVSKIPLKALGVLAQNNRRKYLPGFDIEGEDSPN